MILRELIEEVWTKGVLGKSFIKTKYLRVYVSSFRADWTWIPWLTRITMIECWLLVVDVWGTRIFFSLGLDPRR